MKEKLERKAFTTHRENGVYLKFPNGNTLSTIWGRGSYSENHDWENPKDSSRMGHFAVIPEGSNTVEVMVGCPEKTMRRICRKFPENDTAGDNILTYLTLPQWVELVKILNN
jgi:hypothetical protein